MGKIKFEENIDLNDMNMPDGFGQITGIISELPDEEQEQDFNIRNSICLTLDSIVPFPYIALPVRLSPEDYEIAKKAEESKETIVLANLKPGIRKAGGIKDLYKNAVASNVLKTIELPDGSLTAIFGILAEVKIKKILKLEPFICVSCDVDNAVLPESQNAMEELKVSLEALNELFVQMANSFEVNPQIKMGHQNFKNLLKAAGYICCIMPASYEDKLQLREEKDMNARIVRAMSLLQRSDSVLQMRRGLMEKTRSVFSERQREQFLREEMETIRTELEQLTGGTDFIDPEKGLENHSDNPDIAVLLDRAKEKKWKDETKAVFYKQLSNLDRIPISSPDYSIQYTYLDNFLNLPWLEYSEKDFTLEEVESKLNEDHYGLEKVKDRILDQMAVVKLRGDLKSPILCLYGPPGVGKTSLGKSVAAALGREYARVSLGGLHDEAEIRGHRRTYLGALPGRIISALMKCKTSNPVIVLDEVDKIGADHKGDPSSALLEVLDPEQNSAFHDNYLDCEYDLSRVLFMATANTLQTVSSPLKDRMELIEITGYILEEKVEIARRHLIPKELEEHGFAKDELEFSDEAIRFIINSYTRESGVRLLDKKISEAMRKLARMKVTGKEMPKIVKKELLSSFFGKEEVNPEVYENNDYAGVVTGLAWTQVGGEILFIETALTKGKGDKLTLTGNLGDVMKESAAIALQYIRSHAEKIGIPESKFTEFDVHIHVPEGAIPKDGPSAGITMATSLASAFSGRRVRDKLAMTGEITLRGKVLPVGGIKEKILAAKRAGITDIILSESNRKDIDEIPSKYLEDLTFHFVERIEQVLEIALLQELAPF